MLILVVAEKHSGRLSEEEGTLGKMCPPKKLTLILKSLKKENLSEHGELCCPLVVALKNTFACYIHFKKPYTVAFRDHLSGCFCSKFVPDCPVIIPKK